MLCCLRYLIACNTCVFRVGCVCLLSVILKLSFGGKISLVVRIWLSIRISHEALHARSRLFMTTLMSQSCWALVAQVLLVDILIAEMPKYCGCCDKFVWPNDDPLEDWEVSWEPMLWRAVEDFASYGSMRALVSSSVVFCIASAVFKLRTIHDLCALL
jgi:hypothetical protein